jgi:hypothetical protein
MDQTKPIDGSTATLAELRHVGIDALVKAPGPVGMARFLQQFNLGRGDYTAERNRILGNPTIDELGDDLERKQQIRPEMRFFQSVLTTGRGFTTSVRSYTRTIGRVEDAASRRIPRYHRNREIPNRIRPCPLVCPHSKLSTPTLRHSTSTRL